LLGIRGFGAELAAKYPVHPCHHVDDNNQSPSVLNSSRIGFHWHIQDVLMAHTLFYLYYPKIMTVQMNRMYNTIQTPFLIKILSVSVLPIIHT
jgi:hypothetical protein